ncbi:CwfJ C-terminus 1-domain-containing protein-like protein [Chytriomyces cf. hyalinus JEL632]|nr:CwfJ C-terminus 1-domain-containing protein-like protein [Chytriomyces cf. hyalinus JEL632]
MKVLVFSIAACQSEADFSAALSKTASINGKHGPFGFMLCVGDFYAALAQYPQLAESLLAGKIEVQTTTYIIAGKTPIPSTVQAHIEMNGGELCPNLYHLGPTGLYTTTHGVKIAYVSGLHTTTTTTSTDETSPTSSSEFTDAAIETVLAGLRGQQPQVDVLITTEFAHGVARRSLVAGSRGVTVADGSAGVAALVKGVRPRYHFAASCSLERESVVVEAVPADGVAVEQESEKAALEKDAAAVVKENDVQKTGGLFFEREPYMNEISEGEKNAIVTRFIGLAKYPGSKSKSKERWFYAFNVVPMSTLDEKTLYQMPPNVTSSPFASNTHSQNPARKRVGEEANNGGNYFYAGDNRGGKSHKVSAPPDTYVCRICQQPGHWITDCAQRGNNKPSGPVNPNLPPPGSRDYERPPPEYVCKICGQGGHYITVCPEKAMRTTSVRASDRDPGACWFCLSSPNLEKHLLVTIQEETYIACAKGGLSPWGGHLLIVPVGHFGSRADIMDKSPEVLKEMDASRDTISKAVEEQTGDVAVFFEVYPGGSGRMHHMHVQAVPIPAAMQYKIRDLFLQAATRDSLVAMPEGAIPADPSTPYVRIELPDKGQVLVLTLPVNGDPRTYFNQQFARRVLADALGFPDKANWKRCVVSQEEEGAFATSMKKFLKF